MNLAKITILSLFLAFESCFTFCIHKIVVEFELGLVARLKLDELPSIDCLVLSTEVQPQPVYHLFVDQRRLRFIVRGGLL